MILLDNAIKEITKKVNELDGYIYWHDEEIQTIIETMISMGYVIVHPKWSYENREPQWICECGWKSIELIQEPCPNCGSGAAYENIKYETSNVIFNCCVFL